MQPKPMVFRRILFAILSLAFFTLSAGAQQTPSQQGAVPPRITQPVDEANLVTLKGNTHPLARPQFDLGPAPANLPLNRMLLVLSRSPEQETALQALLDQQQDKFSPNYHNWVTPEQFGQQFGPADQDLQAVTSWLQTHGFQVSRVSKGRVVVEFSGTASQLQEAFHTEIHKYAVNGEEHWANSSDPQIPAALAPVVTGVASLNGFPRHPMIHIDGTFSRSKATGKIESVKPLLTTPGGGCGVSGNCYGLGPFDFATIYNVSPLWTATTPIDGTGQTIAIVGETDINPQDVTAFRTFFGMPAPNLNVVYDGPDPGILTDEETEADLDVEWSGAVAKGATIDFVVSAATETTHGIDLSAEYIVDNNLAPVMSESYGECELGIGTSGNQFFSQLWQQAAAQGITVFISAGDNGSAGCDNFDATTRPAPSEYGLQVSGYASTPYNVAVGGTDFNDALNPTLYWRSTNAATTQESAISYIPEEAWNNTCTNGIFASLGYTANAQTNCNNAQLVNFVSTIGGSGGKSACTISSGQEPSTCSGGYAKPSWQTGSGVPSDRARDIPDVSLYAAGAGSPSGAGYIVCQTDATSGSSCDQTNPNTQFLLVGGTSAASPSFAGVMALIDQKTASHQGNANYVLYKLAAQAGATCTSAPTPASTCVFYDIPAGSTNAMPCASESSSTCVVSTPGDEFGVLSGYGTTAGYDLATGLGSVNAYNLVNQWSNVKFSASSTSLTISTGASGVTHGASVNFTINVKAQTGTAVPTGLVSLIADAGTGPSGQVDVGTFTLASGTCSGSPCATVSGSTNLLPGGIKYNVFAHYPGDGTFGASDSTPQQVTVDPEASTTTVTIVTFNPNTGQVTNSNATSFGYGSLYFLRANVDSLSGATCAQNGLGQTGCPTGTVTLTDNGSPLDGIPAGSGQYTLNSQGYAEDQPIFLFAGQHSLVAKYSGDNSFNASTSPTDTVTVTKAVTATGLITNSTNLQTGQFVLLTGTMVAQAFARVPSDLPTGTIQFLVGSTPLAGQVNYVASNQLETGYAQYVATLSTNSLPVGSDTITAQYLGDSNYAQSPASNSATINVDIASTTTVTSSNPSIQAGQSVTFTATVAPGQSGGPPLTGTIEFEVNGAISGGPVALQNGQALLTTSSLPVGNIEVNATYSGDSHYAASYGILFETVVGIPTTSVVTTSTPSIQEGSNVIFTVTVASSKNGGPTPTGTIQFAVNSSYVATAGLNANAQATFSTQTLPAGSDTITATYFGDSTYAGSSGIVSETVAAVTTFIITDTSPLLVVTSPGQSASTSLTFTALNGFAGSTTLTSAMCSHLPSESTCTFSNPSTVNLTAQITTQTVTLTVITTAASSMTPSARRFIPGSWPRTARIALACVFCFSLLLLGLRARQRRWNLVLACVVLVAIATFPSCGGGGSSGPPPPPPNPGTPVGNYTGVTVTVTMGGITQSINTIAVNVE
jgi:hypothetical protein